ncbi:MAG: signal peptidase II [Lachnospiraceae bacterium]
MPYILISLGAFLLDHHVKEYTNTHRLQGETESYLNKKIVLRNLHNPNGALGIFKNHKEDKEKLTFAVLLVLLWEFIRSLLGKGSKAEKLGLALLLGGGWSNYYEQKSKGYVTDYVSFNVKFEKLRRLVFNISDFFIMAGALIYAVAKVTKGFKNS